MAPRMFTQGLLQGEEGLQHAQKALRRLIGEYGWRGMSAEQVALRVLRKMFLQSGLSGKPDGAYNRRAYDALATYALVYSRSVQAPLTCGAKRCFTMRVFTLTKSILYDILEI